MLGVNQAKYMGGYTLQLAFNNGRTGTANLEPTIFNDRRPIFAKLKDAANFQAFKVEHNTVVWSDELDLAAEYLFYLAFQDDPALQEQFERWGYLS